MIFFLIIFAFTGQSKSQIDVRRVGQVTKGNEKRREQEHQYQASVDRKEKDLHFHGQKEGAGEKREQQERKTRRKNHEGDGQKKSHVDSTIPKPFGGDPPRQRPISPAHRRDPPQRDGGGSGGGSQAKSSSSGERVRSTSAVGTESSSQQYFQRDGIRPGVAEHALVDNQGGTTDLQRLQAQIAGENEVIFQFV